ncbi:uncharacterized protein LACBIDRAFT_298427 [Laccaria bicolor S238N-H82]|uniref:Predicted protein n=1 Tax=Laccaria bicolor (strain S238N-H82 / ATCC MYA-4686) TaxID=486041 RepID=B0DCU3_LACBS|nr:uncharacterized protein LACBIDRAFT_298427 [Laccaria bicolor S238N-H82]EDR07501.1 predicted protein [Laccaria bicolor S238N-H82]|eukprot:XP_001881893.1 predicted protein [Laccaria bicolor S238N-H82]
MTGSATPPFPNTQSPHRSIGHQSIRDGRTLHRDGQDPISGVSTKKSSQYGAVEPNSFERNTQPRFGGTVYYRLYTKDGPIKSQHPVYSTDHEPFIGRTLAKLVAPPHTTVSIKRHLCYIEGFLSSLADTAKLFVPLSCLTAKDDSARLSLVGSSGPGLSPQEPMALVLGGQERAQGAVHQLPLAERDISDFGKNRYIYYRPYSLEGAIKSKTCFDESDIYLGCIDTVSVPPPHTIASLTACIARIEGLVVQDTKEIQIFKDAASEVPMRTDATLSLTEDAYLGNDEDDPVAVVHTPHRLQNTDITLVPGHCDPSWFSIMPTNTLRPDKNNGKEFYLLPIHETIRLEAPFKANGVLIFQSAAMTAYTSFADVITRVTSYRALTI